MLISVHAVDAWSSSEWSVPAQDGRDTSQYRRVDAYVAIAIDVASAFANDKLSIEGFATAFGAARSPALQAQPLCNAPMTGPTWRE
jgi:hypothetical protein